MSEHLAVSGVCKSFPYGEGRLEVLRQVDLCLAPGALATIVGASGSGKSTLLHVLGGMEPPDCGEVRLEGESIYGLSSEQRSRWRNRRVGFVFQFHHLLPEFTALENIAMPLLVRGESLRSAAGRADGLARELEIGHRLHSLPGELSGGEQQRVAIGRALITGPALLLMDEPTGNLDHRTGERVMEIAMGLASRQQTTVVLVTHNPALASRGARRFEMRDGRLEAADPGPA